MEIQPSKGADLGTRAVAGHPINTPLQLLQLRWGVNGSTPVVLIRKYGPSKVLGQQGRAMSSSFVVSVSGTRLIDAEFGATPPVIPIFIITALDHLPAGA